MALKMKVSKPIAPPGVDEGKWDAAMKFAVYGYLYGMDPPKIAVRLSKFLNPYGTSPVVPFNILRHVVDALVLACQDQHYTPAPYPGNTLATFPTYVSPKGIPQKPQIDGFSGVVVNTPPVEWGPKFDLIGLDFAEVESKTLAYLIQPNAGKEQPKLTLIDTVTPSMEEAKAKLDEFNKAYAKIGKTWKEHVSAAEKLSELSKETGLPIVTALQKGPVNQPVFIETEEQLIEALGAPFFPKNEVKPPQYDVYVAPDLLEGFGAGGLEEFIQKATVEAAAAMKLPPHMIECAGLDTNLEKHTAKLTFVAKPAKPKFNKNGDAYGPSPALPSIASWKQLKKMQDALAEGKLLLPVHDGYVYHGSVTGHYEGPNLQHIPKGAVPLGPKSAGQLAADICAVQPMAKNNGIVEYMKNKLGLKKGATVAVIKNRKRIEEVE